MSATPREPEQTTVLADVLAIPCTVHGVGPGEACPSEHLSGCVERIRRAGFGSVPGRQGHPFFVPAVFTSAAEHGSPLRPGELAARAAARRESAQ